MLFLVMKYFTLPKCCALLLSILLLHKTNAAPGDTTWVQAQNDVQLDYYNDFDANVTFPNGSVTYSKIIMLFTLGKYQCPTGTQYCGDWDYTIQNYLMTATDTIELSRLITPYANASYPRTPWSWKEHYYFDVTDFYPLLKNNVAIRLSYHNYSGGFTGNIRFAFIEGTPPRNVTGIKKLWEGSFNYGDPAAPIDNYITPATLTAPAGTQYGELKFTVTGHGSDNTGCSEFCSKYYQVKQNNVSIAQKQIWKADCGYNDLYPQSGTWIYDRANWCPGQQVLPATYKLNSITAGTNYIADVDFQSYTRSGTGTPSYTVSGRIVYYGAFNNNLDAEIKNIIAPSNYEGYFRSNPICGKPVVRIRNTGATTISTVSFQYGITGQTMQTHTVTGLSLASLEEATITLPELSLLTTIPGGMNEFAVTIQQVNGATDNYTINNTLKTVFTTAPDWPAEFTVVIKSNNFGTQTSWRIEDLAGNIIIQRNPASPQTTYRDTITSLSNGCYRLVVTDAGCDGLYWWANASSTGTGWIYVIKSDGTYVPFTNGLPLYPSTLSQDFGCGFTQYFRIAGGIITAAPDISNDFTVVLSPNPFTEALYLKLSAVRPQHGIINLYNMKGQALYTKNVNILTGANSITIDGLAKLMPGVYMVVIDLGGQKIVKKVVK